MSETPRVDSVLNSSRGEGGVCEELEKIYGLARLMENELKAALEENNKLRKIRDRQASIIRQQEQTINEYEEEWIDENV